MSAVISYPFADATVEAITDAATSTVTISNRLTILRAAAGFAQAVTGLSLSAADGLPVGSAVIVDILQNATGRNVTFGSAGDTITAPALTGVANDRDTITLVWNGTAFVASTLWNKIVDAV